MYTCAIYIMSVILAQDSLSAPQRFSPTLSTHVKRISAYASSVRIAIAMQRSFVPAACRASCRRDLGVTHRHLH